MMYKWSGNEDTVYHKVVSCPAVHAQLSMPLAENVWWFDSNSYHGGVSRKHNYRAKNAIIREIVCWLTSSIA